MGSLSTASNWGVGVEGEFGIFTGHSNVYSKQVGRVKRGGGSKEVEGRRGPL